MTSASFAKYYALWLQNPPDRNGPIPLSNRPETIYGATLPFHILSWLAVLFRLYIRFKVVRKPGKDDFFIVASAILNLISLLGLIVSIQYGMGKHLIFVDPAQTRTLFKLLYVQHATYFTCTGLIKISLLCQYLRMFKTGMLRRLCLILLVLVCLWSAFWGFQGWFPCFPVSGNWNRTDSTVCWGIGYGSLSGAVASLYSFAATNIILDTAIFCVPMAVYFKPGLGKKEVFALLALFTLGSVVVLMSILRLWTVARNSVDDIWTLDFTWWYPLTLIIATLEIDFAIITASIPIFWPVLVAALPQIFVTQEVHITHQTRLPDSGGAEYEMDRASSMKSNNSQEGLTRKDGSSRTNYGDPFVLDHVTGKVPENIQIEVPRKPAKKWLR